MKNLDEPQWIEISLTSPARTSSRQQSADLKQRAHEITQTGVDHGHVALKHLDRERRHHPVNLDVAVTELMVGGS